MCLKCAVELHIPDAILSHVMVSTVSELSAALSIPPSKTRCLCVLMRLLSHEGAFRISCQMPFGKTLWDLAGDQPEFNGLFNKGMASDCRVVMDVVTHIGGSSFHGITTLVDVGGGTGKTVAALVEAFPELLCTVFDLPHVANTAPKIPGAEFIGGDMFVGVPPADTILL
ncbi:(RS)-norcoclaurine 6-O-methyltransferase [Apostasia shenzhenica]|uniref:(RS)-norcoclaurine 6-O-methyltransferase n=1 Tax=Apostasia shenzhenica TaxID=1088818 RepID=A0A2H9ZVC9_9ASPA|nr:(RS)-norcoclaurine 6-O-methyltransferase [Apostasia shenzhenica]